MSIEKPYNVVAPVRFGEVHWLITSSHETLEQARISCDALIAQGEADSYPSPGPQVWHWQSE